MNDKSDELSIGLCLSGGGLRSAFFHLGVVCALRDMGLLKNVKEIYSVSGGSILAAHLAAKWNTYQSAPTEELDETLAEFLKIAKRDIRGRVLRRWLLSWMFVIPGLLRFDRIFYLRQEYSKALKIGTETIANQLTRHASHPAFHFLATSFNTGETCAFSKTRFVSTDGKKNSVDIAGDGIPLSFVVAASSAFPPLFPPAHLTSKIAGMPKGNAFSPLALADGGIYDNLGFAKFLELENAGQTFCNFVIVSDGSGAFVKDVSRAYRFLIPRTVRSMDILMRRLADETIRIAEARGHTKACRLSLSEELMGSQFPASTQEVLGTIRTDLDRFSDEEVAILFVRGYEVCARKLDNFSPARTPSRIYEKFRSRIRFENLTSLLAKSARRKLGLFNGRDWATYAILSIGLIPLLLFLFGVQQATEAQQRIAEQETRIESLGEQINRSLQNQPASTPSSADLIAQVNKPDFKVYIQFAGYDRKDIVALATNLGKEWTVPNTGERLGSARRLREVRFGPDTDKPAATALAEDVEKNAAIGSRAVALKRVSGIPKGTLELWIGLE